MRQTKAKRLICIMLSLLLISSMVTPVFAFAKDGVIYPDEIRMVYRENEVAVPDTDANGKTHKEYLTETNKLELDYKLIDTEMPDNGYVKWYSEAPTLVDVDQNGTITAYDSSKGTIIQMWIDNEVKSIPLVGSVIASLLEKAFYNDYIDIDKLDTDAIINIVEKLFSVNTKYSVYTNSLVESLREYLDNMNTVVHVQLYDGEDNMLAEDKVEIVVQKNNVWYSYFLPNGTHITNKSQIDTTVAVGSSVQLQAITTPKRLNYGVVYSVKSTTLFSQGKVVATVNDSGEVKFKNPGTVTIQASPDTRDIVNGIVGIIDKLAKLDPTSTIDTNEVAGILIDYLGVDINRNVLKGVLDAAFFAKDIYEGTADPVQGVATAVEVVANFILQYLYKDTITFTVVETQPLTNFTISGLTTVEEGSAVQLTVANPIPEGGDTSDVVWTSSDPSVASVDPVTGVVIGRDCGGSLGAFSSKTCTITATSKANNVSKSVTMKVTGKTGNYISDVEIIAPENLNSGEEADLTYNIYPLRNANSRYLTVTWGIQTGVDEETGAPIFSWATDDADVTNGIGSIDANGHYVAIKGGLTTVALKAVTGYNILGGFYEISNVISTVDIQNDTPIDAITLSAENVAFVGSLDVTEQEVNGELRKFAEVKINVATAYCGKGVRVKANIDPADATNTNVIWHIDNDNFSLSNEDKDEKTVEVKLKAGKENAANVNIWCESEDGTVKSEVMTLSVTRNSVTGNKIDQDELSTEVGNSVDATHTVEFEGSWTTEAYADCGAIWYSPDESIFTVEPLNDKGSNARITGVDVGTATLYCVSADGGIVDSKTVTVYPNKELLSTIISICEKTVIVKTDENASLYSDYMRKLDKAYYVLYDVEMASQSTCDTYATELLDAFVKLGGFVSVGVVNITDKDGAALASKYITVNVSSVRDYRKYSYDFDYEITPENAMTSKVEWTSSNSKISVDSNGVCKPTENNPCSAEITCTVYDYAGNSSSASVYVSFARTAATGITLNKTEITEGNIGESEKLTATVLPNGAVNKASCTAVVWSTDNEHVATVDEDGTVHFIKGGNAVITATTADGGFTAECAVTVVTNYNNLDLLVTKYNSYSVNEANYSPSTYATYADAMSRAQTMLDERTASQEDVDAMYAELEDAYNGLEKYNRLQKVELYLDGEATADYYQYDLDLIGDLNLYSKATLNLNVRLYPKRASYKKVTWTTSTSDLKVDGEGNVSPKYNKACYGAVTCTVTDDFGRTFSDEVWVSFAKYPVTGIELSKHNMVGCLNETLSLKANLTPEGKTTAGITIGKADIQDIQWISGNENVATVDENGNVTFVGSGSTTITAITCDGGYSDVCNVSTEADRTVLQATVDTYADLDYMEYEYAYGSAFKAAYDAAVAVVDDAEITQQQVDDITADLVEAADALEGHPFVAIERIDLDWVSYKKTSAFGSDRTEMESGTVGDNNGIQINIEDNYSVLNNNNSCDITASVYPENAQYETCTWEVIRESYQSNTPNGLTLTTNPSNGVANGLAVYKVVFTDGYGRTYDRTFTIYMGDCFVTGVDITTPDYSTLATEGAVQLEYTLSCDTGKVKDIGYPNVSWSSSNTKVATVDEEGYVYPVDIGTAVITVTTEDGGHTDSITVTVTADFDELRPAVESNRAIVDEAKGNYVYTQESLDALETAVENGEALLDSETATQYAVDKAYAAINAANRALEEYVPCEGMNITLEESEEAAVINDGYIRYTANSLNGKSLKLNATTLPAGSRFEQVEWSSDNSAVTVSEDGTVTSTSAAAKAALITCTVTNYDGTAYIDKVYVSFVRSGISAIAFDAETDYFGIAGTTAKVKPVITYTNDASVSTYAVSNCIFTSSDESVATVAPDGTVTFVSFGSAVITATTLDGGYTASTTVYTTNDTTELKELLSEADALSYTDYAYEYGVEFKNKLSNAFDVFNNYASTQAEIDTACEELEAAMEAALAHPFIASETDIFAAGKAFEDGAAVVTDKEGKINFNAVFAPDISVKSYTFECTELENATAEQVADNEIVLTRTAAQGTATLVFTTVDEYDRETVVTKTVKLVDEYIPATDFVFTANGDELAGNSYTYSCGGNYSNINLVLGNIVTPADANIVESVTYSSSSSTVKIDAETGKVKVSGLLLLSSSYSTTITCTINNADGTQVTKTLSLTVKKK